MTSQEKSLIFSVSIGDVVKAWRKVRNWTLAELAQRCDSTITKGYLSQLENNRIEQPNDDHLLRIAKALTIPVEYLLMRRLPTEQDTQEKDVGSQSASRPTQSSEQPSVALEEEEGFTFGSPIPAPRREEPSEEEELLQILAEIDELRSRVKKLITRKKKRKPDGSTSQKRA